MKRCFFLFVILLTHINWIYTEVQAQDNTRPSVRIDAPSTPQNGLFQVRVEFSEAVSDFEQAELLVTGMPGTSITSWSPSPGGMVYRAGITPTSEGVVVLDVPPDVAEDNAGNSNTAANQKTVLIDMTSPSATINVPSGVQTEDFDVTVEFSEVVLGFEQAELVVTGTAGASITNWDPQTGRTDYVATITPTQTGTAIFNVVFGGAEDAAGNRNTPVSQQTVTVDMTVPTVTINVPSDVQNSTFDVTVEFSEAVSDFEQAELVITGTADASITTWDPQTGGTDYVATITSMQTGTAIFNVDADVAVDAGGHSNTAATQQTVEVDTVKPSPTINVPLTPQNDVFEVTIVFSEPVSNFIQSDFRVDGGVSFSGWSPQTDEMTYIATFTPVDTSTVRFNVDPGVAEDAAGNSNTAATEQTVTVDITSPSVSINASSIVTTRVFDVTVIFGEPVSGFRQTELVVGGTASASITSWSPQTGGTDYVATITATSDGEVVLEVAANVAVDAADNGNPAANPQMVKVDSTPPSVTITVPSGPQDKTFFLTVEFSELVSGFIQSELVLSGTTGASITSWTPFGGTRYRATITTTSEGSVVLNIAANVAEDAAGHANTAATQQTVLVDSTPPSVTITAPSGVQTEDFDVTVVFSEPVSGFIQSELTINGAEVSITDWDPQTGGTTYIATITPIGAGRVEFNIGASVAVDAAGYGNRVSIVRSVDIDAVHPSPTLNVPSTPQNGNFQVRVEFSEAVSDFEQAELLVTGTAGASITSWSPSPGGMVYRAVIAPTSNGSVVLDVAADVAEDTAGNSNTAANQKTVLIDMTSPSAIINVPSTLQVSVFDVTVKFSEAVSDFEQAELLVTGTAGASITNWDPQTGGTDYVATITPTQTGTAIFNVVFGAAEDAAGNRSTPVSPQTVDVDLTDVTINVPAGLQNGLFDVTVTFSRPVSGFLQSELVVSGTAGASITTWSPQTGGTDYVATITSTQTGTAIFNVAADVAVDAASNGNTVATQQTVEVDTVKPSPTINVPLTPQNDVFEVTIVFSEPVSNFIQSDFRVEGGVSFSGWSPQTDEMTYIATFTPVDTSTVIFNVGAGVAEDAAGNGNTAATEQTVTVDLTPPSVSINASSIVTTRVFDVTVIFSEPVSGFQQAELVVGGTASASITSWSPQTGGTDYVATITATSDGDVMLEVAANVAVDAADNGNRGANSRVVKVDSTPPSVAITVPSGPQGTSFYVTVEFSELVSGFLQSELVLSGTTGASITNWTPFGGTRYRATITTTSEGSVVLNIAANVAEDAAGHANTAATQQTVLVDSTPPSVTITAPSGVQTEDFDVTVVFSELVSGFIQSELTISGAEVSITDWDPQTGGTTYIATITPIGAGRVQFSIGASVAVDAAGYGNRVSMERLVDIDAVHPSPTLNVPSTPQNRLFEVRVEFSEAVSDFEQSELLVSGTPNASITSWYTPPGGMVYRAGITPTSEGEVVLNVAADVAEDTAGNSNTAANQKTVLIDMTSPSAIINVPSTLQVSVFDVTVKFSEAVSDFEQAELLVTGTAGASITNWDPQTGGTDYVATITPTQTGTAIFNVVFGAAEDAAGNRSTPVSPQTVDVDLTDVTINVPAGLQNGLFDVTVTFSRPVSGFLQSELVVSGTAGASITTWSPQTGGTDYVATITSTQTGTVIFNVAADVAVDAASNGNTAATQQTVEVDAVKPSATINVPSTPKNNVFEVTIVFSEPVSNFIQSDFRVEGGVSFSGWSPQTDEMTYIATFTPVDTSTVRFNVDSGVAEDAAGNGNTAATEQTVTVDLTPPSVSINASSIVTTRVFDVTVIFSEPVSGFQQAELVVGGTASASITSWSPQTGGTDYVATITATSDGDVMLEVAANVAVDAADNGNRGANSRVVKVDSTPPSVAITVPSGPQGTSFYVTVEFSELVSGFLQSELVLGGTTGASITNWTPFGGTRYRATITTTSEGSVVLNIAANVAEDAAGHANTAATQQTVLVDSTPPSVTITAPSGVQTEDFDVTVVFSELVSGFIQSELTISGAEVSITDWDPQTGGTTYIATITPMGAGRVQFSIGASVAVDAAGYGNRVSMERLVDIDAVHPSPTLNVPSTPQNRLFEVRVEFSEAVSDFEQAELLVSGTASASITSWYPSPGGMVYRAGITPTSEGSVVLNVAADVAEDTAGNSNTAANQKTVLIDMTSPSAIINVPSTLQVSVFDVTVKFSEAVSDFEQAELLVSGTASASITSWDPQTDGMDYVATITPTQTGTAIFNVVFGAAEDAAGNRSTPVSQQTVTVDMTVPTVTINVPPGPQNGVFDVTVEFSEVVSGFQQSELVVGGTASASITSWSPQTGGTDYVATITPTSDGEVLLDVAADVVVDAADNGTLLQPSRRLR